MIHYVYTYLHLNAHCFMFLYLNRFLQTVTLVENPGSCRHFGQQLLQAVVTVAVTWGKGR